MTRQDYCPNSNFLWGSNKWVQSHDLLLNPQGPDDVYWFQTPQGPDDVYWFQTPQGPDDVYWFSESLSVFRKPSQQLWGCTHRNHVDLLDPTKDRYLTDYGATPRLACQALLGDPIEVLGHLYYPMVPKGSGTRLVFRNHQAPLGLKYLIQSPHGEWSTSGWQSLRGKSPEEALLDLYTQQLPQAKSLREKQEQEIRQALQALQDNRSYQAQVAKWLRLR